MTATCPRCGARQKAASTRFPCAGCGKPLRVRRSWPRWSRVAAIAAVGALGFGVARWTESPRPVSGDVEPVRPIPRGDPAYLQPSLPWDAQASDVIRGLDHEFGPGRFRYYTSRPFVIAVERSDDVETPVGELLECIDELYTNFARTFRVPLGFVEVGAALPVLILSTPESYQAYVRDHSEAARALDVWGRYEYSRGRVVMLYHPADGAAMLRHEAVHQLVHAVTAPRDARGLYWFQEGLAMLFESGPERDGPFGVNRGRLAGLREAVKGGVPGVALPELLALDIEGFWDRKARGGDVSTWARDCYAESWGLVYFLYKRHRAVLHEYARMELEGRGGPAAFEAVVRRAAGKDLTEFEREWLDFVSSLHF